MLGLGSSSCPTTIGEKGNVSSALVPLLMSLLEDLLYPLHVWTRPPSLIGACHTRLRPCSLLLCTRDTKHLCLHPVDVTVQPSCSLRLYEQDSVVTEWEHFLQGIACSPRPPSVKNREFAVDASNFSKCPGGVTCCTHDGHLDSADGDAASLRIETGTLRPLEDSVLGKKHEGVYLNVRGGQITGQHHQMSRSERRHYGKRSSLSRIELAHLV